MTIFSGHKHWLFNKRQCKWFWKMAKGRRSENINKADVVRERWEQMFLKCPWFFNDISLYNDCLQLYLMNGSVCFLYDYVGDLYWHCSDACWWYQEWKAEWCDRGWQKDSLEPNWDGHLWISDISNETWMMKKFWECSGKNIPGRRNNKPRVLDMGLMSVEQNVSQSR